MSKAWAQTVAIDDKTEDISRAIRDWSVEAVDVVLDVVGSTTSPHALVMLRPAVGWFSILTVTEDGDIARDWKEAEERGFRKITLLSTWSERRSSAGDHQFD